jgi:hypothetical protein
MPIFYPQGVQSMHVLSMLTPFACICACVCVLQVSEVVDLAAVQNGGKAVGCSDMHFGHPKNLINPGRCDKAHQILGHHAVFTWCTAVRVVVMTASEGSEVWWWCGWMWWQRD